MQVVMICRSTFGFPFALSFIANKMETAKCKHILLGN